MIRKIAESKRFKYFMFENWRPADALNNFLLSNYKSIYKKKSESILFFVAIFKQKNLINFDSVSSHVFFRVSNQ